MIIGRVVNKRLFIRLSDSVVSVTVELVSVDGYGSLLLVGDLDSGGVEVEVEVGTW